MLLMQPDSYADTGYLQHNIQQSIDRARTFLVRKVVDDQYYLACRSIPAKECILTKEGKILTGYFIVSAFYNRIPGEVYTKIKNQILAENRGTLWGYSLNSPVDADDTSFAIQTAAMLGISLDTSTLERFYKQRMNGYATFISNREALPTHLVSPPANFGIHPEVNANIYHLFNRLHLSTKINYSLIRKFQARAGYWYSYFYPGKYYSTYLNLRLLCAAGQLRKQVEKGVQFIITSQNRDGSWGSVSNAYDTALALNSLLACGYSKEKQIKKGIDYLLSQQVPQGYWKTNSVIWSYDHQNAPLVRWSAYDSEHVITTALVVRALTDYLNSNRVN